MKKTTALFLAFFSTSITATVMLVSCKPHYARCIYNRLQLSAARSATSTASLRTYDTVNIDSFLMGTTIYLQELAYEPQSLPGAAYATSVTQYSVMTERITNIKVITLRDYNVSMPLGTDIIAHCKLINAAKNEVTKDQLLQSFRDTLYEFEQPYFALQLLQRPDAGMPQQLAVQVEINHGAKLLSDTTVIFFVQ